MSVEKIMNTVLTQIDTVMSSFEEDTKSTKAKTGSAGTKLLADLEKNATTLDSKLQKKITIEATRNREALKEKVAQFKEKIQSSTEGNASQFTKLETALDNCVKALYSKKNMMAFLDDRMKSLDKALAKGEVADDEVAGLLNFVNSIKYSIASSQEESSAEHEVRLKRLANLEGKLNDLHIEILEKRENKS